MMKKHYIAVVGLLTLSLALMGAGCSAGKYSKEVEGKSDLNAKELSMLRKSSKQVKDTKSVEIKESEKENLVIMPFDYFANLSNLSESNLSGIVKVTNDGEVFTLLSIASGLPDLNDGMSYQGWLIRQDDFQVVPTGMLVKQNADYVNYFKSQTDFTDHLFYVITKQEANSKVPQEQLLEAAMKRVR